MKGEEFVRKLTGLFSETKAGKVKWNILVQTTEGNENKPSEVEDGVTWTLDEVYVSFQARHKNEEFNFITYELIKESDKQVKTSNLVFIPPEGVRYFDLGMLLPHSIVASAVMMNQIHQLWLMLLDMNKQGSENIKIDAVPGELVIED